MQKTHKKIANNCIGLNSFSRLSLLSIGVLLAMTPEAKSEDYFDPSFLALSGEESQVDLSAFAQTGGVAEGDYTVCRRLRTPELDQ